MCAHAQSKAEKDAYQSYMEAKDAADGSDGGESSPVKVPKAEKPKVKRDKGESKGDGGGGGSKGDGGHNALISGVKKAGGDRADKGGKKAKKEDRDAKETAAEKKAAKRKREEEEEEEGDGGKAQVVERVECPEFGAGWMCVTKRRGVSTGAKASDKTYISPDGRSFNSRVKVLKHLGLSEDPLEKPKASNRPLTAKERQKQRQTEQRSRLNATIARSNANFEQRRDSDEATSLTAKGGWPEPPGRLPLSNGLLSAELVPLWSFAVGFERVLNLQAFTPDEFCAALYVHTALHPPTSRSSHPCCPSLSAGLNPPTPRSRPIPALPCMPAHPEVGGSTPRAADSAPSVPPSSRSFTCGCSRACSQTTPPCVTSARCPPQWGSPSCCSSSRRQRPSITPHGPRCCGPSAG